MRKMTAKEALARALPSEGAMYNRPMADRILRWLDQCGYEIVEKHDVTIVPADPENEDRVRTLEVH